MSSPPTTRNDRAQPSRVRRGDWLVAGLEILRSDGDRALTVEALCARLGKTKGSFYHHFSSREDFVGRLLEHWEQTFTLRIIEDLEPLTDPLRRLRALSDRTTRDVDLPLERAIRIWSDHEPAAAGVLARVDARREDYLLELFTAALDDPATAKLAARAHMAILVGVQMLYRDLSRDELRTLNRFVDTLGYPQPSSNQETQP